MTKKDEIIALVADKTGIDVPVLQAVVAVETNGQAFLPDGRPTILFEAHVFWRELQRACIDPESVLRENPKYDIVLSKSWNRRLYKGGAAEYDRLALAEEIDREAALMSCSWGLFQIMGFNHIKCCCAKIDTFVARQQTVSGQAQTAADFLIVGNFVPLLKAHAWARFARLYNGPGYTVNQYDEKLAKAYARYKRA